MSREFSKVFSEVLRLESKIATLEADNERLIKILKAHDLLTGIEKGIEALTTNPQGAKHE